MAATNGHVDGLFVFFAIKNQVLSLFRYYKGTVLLLPYLKIIGPSAWCTVRSVSFPLLYS